MSAFVELQEKEFAAADRGFTAVKHQREVGTGYFDAVTQAIQQGQSSTTALKGSTEEEQFHAKKPPHAAVAPHGSAPYLSWRAPEREARSRVFPRPLAWRASDAPETSQERAHFPQVRTAGIETGLGGVSPGLGGG